MTDKTVDTTKRDKFIELAERRTSMALKYIRLLGNLANKQSYEYETEDFRQIVASLDAEILKLKDKVNGVKPKTQEFKLNVA